MKFVIISLMVLIVAYLLVPLAIGVAVGTTLFVLQHLAMYWFISLPVLALLLYWLK